MNNQRHISRIKQNYVNDKQKYGENKRATKTIETQSKY